MTAQPKLRRRKCKAKGCGQWFRPFNSLEQWCSAKCGYELSLEKLAKKQAKEKLAERRAVKARKRERISAKKAFRENDAKHLRKQARSALHKWIVAVRDADKPCVSSGRTEAVQWQAGHYVPSTNSSTRFDENNIHKQSSEDNLYRSGNLTPYRVELINRIGLAEVERLESSTQVKKWTVEELRAIRDDYRQRLRDAGIPIPRTN